LDRSEDRSEDRSVEKCLQNVQGVLDIAANELFSGHLGRFYADFWPRCGQASAELAVNKHTRIVVYFKYITNLEQFYNLYP
jgi:hypothetical protein